MSDEPGVGLTREQCVDWYLDHTNEKARSHFARFGGFPTETQNRAEHRCRDIIMVFGHLVTRHFAVRIGLRFSSELLIDYALETNQCWDPSTFDDHIADEEPTWSSILEVVPEELLDTDDTSFAPPSQPPSEALGA